MQGRAAQKATTPNPEAHMTALHELALASPEMASMTAVMCSEVRSAARIAALTLGCLLSQHDRMISRGAGGVRSVPERQSRHAQAGDRYTHGGLALVVARGIQPSCCTSHAEHQLVYAESYQLAAFMHANACCQQPRGCAGLQDRDATVRVRTLSGISHMAKLLWEAEKCLQGEGSSSMAALTPPLARRCLYTKSCHV